MKKFISICFVLSIIIFTSSCDIKVSLSDGETKSLYNEAIIKIFNKSFDFSNYTIEINEEQNVIQKSNDKKEYYCLSSDKDQYYLNGYYYINDKIKNIKTKQKMEFNNMEKLLPNPNDFIILSKNLLNGDFIISKTGNKWAWPQSSKFLTLIFDIQKINDNNLFDEKIESLNMILFFNSNGNFEYFELGYSANNKNQIFKTGELNGEDYIPFPNDLNDYQLIE